MKIQKDIWAMAQYALGYISINEKEIKGTKKVIAQLYLTGARINYVNNYISDEQDAKLKKIQQFLHGRFIWQLKKYKESYNMGLADVDHAFVYGMEEGVRLARAYIDKDLAVSQQKLSPEYIKGYQAARAAIGKYTWRCGAIMRKNCNKAGIENENGGIGRSANS